MWGPPGSGKTTLSEVIKNESNLNFVRVSGAESGIKELRVIIDNAKKEKEFFQKRQFYSLMRYTDWIEKSRIFFFLLLK